MVTKQFDEMHGEPQKRMRLCGSMSGCQAIFPFPYPPGTTLPGTTLPGTTLLSLNEVFALTGKIVIIMIMIMIIMIMRTRLTVQTKLTYLSSGGFHVADLHGTSSADSKYVLRLQTMSHLIGPLAECILGKSTND